MIHKMLRIQLTTAHPTKNQENENLKEKRQSKDANTKVNQRSELSDKDFKVAGIKLLQQSIKNYFRTHEALSCSFAIFITHNQAIQTLNIYLI